MTLLKLQQFHTWKITLKHPLSIFRFFLVKLPKIGSQRYKSFNLLERCEPNVELLLKLPPSVFFAFFTFFTLASCENDNPKLPIPREKVIEMLADVHMADAYVESVNPTMKDSMAKLYYLQIFKHHDITAAVYDSTFAVLSKQPDLMKKVYDAVLLKIEERQKIVRGDTLKTDSIKAAPSDPPKKN
jgi:hypothetical protein